MTIVCLSFARIMMARVSVLVLDRRSAIGSGTVHGTQMRLTVRKFHHGRSGGETGSGFGNSCLETCDGRHPVGGIAVREIAE
jgi:hypothetical protein